MVNGDKNEKRQTETLKERDRKIRRLERLIFSFGSVGLLSLAGIKRINSHEYGIVFLLLFIVSAIAVSILWEARDRALNQPTE